VDGSLATAAVIRTANCFAIDGDDFALAQLTNRGNPTHKAVLHLLRVKSSKHTRYRVVRWDAIGQAQECSQPVSLGSAIFFNVCPTVSATNHCTDGEADNIE
jgi:hypothetical protein